MQGIPISLEESAKIDGASYYRIFFQIVLPLCMPVVATVLLFSGVTYWLDFYTNLLYVAKSNLMVAQYLLYNVVRANRMNVLTAQQAWAGGQMTWQVQSEREPAHQRIGEDDRADGRHPAHPRRLPVPTEVLHQGCADRRAEGVGRARRSLQSFYRSPDPAVTTGPLGRATLEARKGIDHAEPRLPALRPRDLLRLRGGRRAAHLGRPRGGPPRGALRRRAAARGQPHDLPARGTRPPARARDPGGDRRRGDGARLAHPAGRARGNRGARADPELGRRRDPDHGGRGAARLRGPRRGARRAGPSRGPGTGRARVARTRGRGTRGRARVAAPDPGAGNGRLGVPLRTARACWSPWEAGA